MSVERESLNTTIYEINDLLLLYEEENQYFSELNGNLSIIASFISEEASVIQQSYEELVNFLATTIIVKRTLARIGLKDRMEAEIAGLECGFLVAFGAESFIQDTTLSIGPTSYEHVIDYINLKLFKDLCIDAQDFELFLSSEILPSGSEKHNINIQDLTKGINLYTSEAMNYYFYSLEDENNGLDRKSVV